jgi:hypothetical protein
VTEGKYRDRDALAHSIHGYDAEGASPVLGCISHGRCAIVNRTQGLVLGFFLTVLASLVAIRVAAPEVYDQVLRLPPSWPRWTATAFLLALAPFYRGAVSGCAAALALDLLADLGGLPGWSAARAGGHFAARWCPVRQRASLVCRVPGLIGVAQLAIGLAMLAGYRRSGVWGAF